MMGPSVFARPGVKMLWGARRSRILTPLRGAVWTQKTTQKATAPPSSSFVVN